jgi:Cdc6-like AAA superfamily ATPase
MNTDIAKLQVSNETIEHNTTVILDEATARRKKALLDNICNVDYLQQHRDAISRHQHGTGDWFLDEDKYQTWTRSSCGTLVCPGVPGAGKTVMAALVIEKQLQATQTSRKPVVFIYYNYKSQDQQTLRHTLQTFLRQVVDFLPEMPKLLDKFTDGKYTPRTEELESALNALLEPIKELTIITDALDECHDSTRGDVLSWIAHLQSNISVRYLATTRDFYPDVSHSMFEGKPLLEIKASRHDLEVYTRSRAKTLRAKPQPDLLEDLVDGVVTAADGM